jgi:hypothetical protein
VSPYAIHKRTCNVCVRISGFIPPWQKEPDLVFRYEPLSWGLFRKTLEASLIMLDHFARQWFITKLYLNVQLLLNCGTNKCRKRYKKYFNTSVPNREDRRLSRFRDLLFNETIPSIHFQRECLSLSLIWLHYTPNISGILRMLLSQSKCVQKFVQFRY